MDHMLVPEQWQHWVVLLVLLHLQMLGPSPIMDAGAVVMVMMVTSETGSTAMIEEDEVV